MNLIEQIGRYACIVLMWLPLLKYLICRDRKDSFGVRAMTLQKCLLCRHFQLESANNI